MPHDVSQAFVVVRHPGPDRPSNLLVLSTNTWQAYNQWGGRCLYSGATEVSFRRPIESGYVTRAVDADGYDGRVANIGVDDLDHQRLQRYLADHEYPAVDRRRAGGSTGSGGSPSGPTAKASSSTTPSTPTSTPTRSVLDGRRLLLTAGHNEYWSWGMRDAVDRFVESGGNWAILSGNTCFWQVRYSAEHAVDDLLQGRRPQRRPRPWHRPSNTLSTSCWSDPLVGRPETTTIGLSFTRGGYCRVGDAVPRGSGGYTVQAPDHWVFAGTGLRYGDEVGASATVVGYEVDGCAMSLSDGSPAPDGRRRRARHARGARRRSRPSDLDHR